MAIGQTISIIKPDAVAKNVNDKIYRRFEKAFFFGEDGVCLRTR